MDKNKLKQALEQARKDSKRNFTQSVDLILNLRGLDLKKPEHQIDVFVTLPNDKGKKVRVAAFVAAELTNQAKEVCDTVMTKEDFIKYQGNKKAIKKLANEYDFFIAQINMMPEVAKTFGSVLGPRKKMPNPKSGCVVPPNANLKALVEKLQKTVRLSSKTESSMKCSVGTEKNTDDQLAENMLAVINTVTPLLPNEAYTIKNIVVKLTMGKPVKITDSKSE